MPRSTVGCDRPNSAISLNHGQGGMMLPLVRKPAPIASMKPAFTEWVKPRSSLVMTIKRASAGRPSRSRSAFTRRSSISCGRMVQRSVAERHPGDERLHPVEGEQVREVHDDICDSELSEHFHGTSQE